MQLKGIPAFREPKLSLNTDAKRFTDLFFSLGEEADNFVPHEIIHLLQNLVRISYEEADDPAKQISETEYITNKLKEYIPGYVQVSLMIAPQKESKAFKYSSERNKFINKFRYYIDTAQVYGNQKEALENILNMHDYSVGTPPVTDKQIDFFYKIFLGDHTDNLRKYRDILGINSYTEQAQWEYLLDVLNQMIIQSTHYTTKDERNYFLNKVKSTVNFKGVNGLVSTVVSGNADTVYDLLTGDMFNKNTVHQIRFTDEEQLFKDISEHEFKNTGIFMIRVKSLITNIFKNEKWFRYLSRMIIVDDSDLSEITNTSLVFSFHNGIINGLDKLHTKKLGALANSQLNLRLILEKIAPKYLKKFSLALEQKIKSYDAELQQFKTENIEQNIDIFKFDNFAQQIIRDRYTLTRFRNYIDFLIRLSDTKNRTQIYQHLIERFEDDFGKYFYSKGRKHIDIVTVPEGGGRNQIKIYGEFLLSKKIKPLDADVAKKCAVILKLMPDVYKRTLKNHFHNNFGINTELEKYKDFIAKQNTEDSPEGNLRNFLTDLGIINEFEAFEKEHPEDSQIFRTFINELIRNKQTSISDHVQMAVHDLLDTENLRPYILFAKDAAWEYKDIFPPEKFDINPFDLEIGLVKKTGRNDYTRLLKKLENIKNDFGLFDGTGKLWAKFSENLVLIINDPTNPLGYSDSGSEDFNKLLNFINGTKITLFLDEAYNDAVKINDPNKPKWRCVSRYVVNNRSVLSKLHLVSSQSTTKNLGAAGNRAGMLISMNIKGLSDFVRRRYKDRAININSVYLLNLTLQTGRLAKRIKNIIEKELDKNAALKSIKSRIFNFIIDESKKENSFDYRYFEGSPLHIFLLNELKRLDKLSMAGLPDNFQFKNAPFFPFYQKELAKSLNTFRANKVFLHESNKRLLAAKEVAKDLGLCFIEDEKNCKFDNIRIVNSDGSYLFNLMIKDFISYQHLEAFAKKTATERGIAVLPYKAGNLRFSLGGRLTGDPKSYRDFSLAFKNVLKIIIQYWEDFYQAAKQEHRKEIKNQTSVNETLDKIFSSQNQSDNIKKILRDFDIIKHQKSAKYITTTINPNTLYSPAPEISGLTIAGIKGSENAVLEFAENIGDCDTLEDFVSSSAFRKIYENFLPQIIHKISGINEDISRLTTKYGVNTILKYISNKREFQPNTFVLNRPDELQTMREILLEIEKLLFSNSKVKIIALDASRNKNIDKAKLEGKNGIIKKMLKELFIQFDLPFENEGLTPSLYDIVEKTYQIFGEITRLSPEIFNIEQYFNHFIEDFKQNKAFAELKTAANIIGLLETKLRNRILNPKQEKTTQLTDLYIITNYDTFTNKSIQYCKKTEHLIYRQGDFELESLFKNALLNADFDNFSDIIDLSLNLKYKNIESQNIHGIVRSITAFFINLINKTKANEYYFKYTNTVTKLTEAHFIRQKSRNNEMFQHGITIFNEQHITMRNGLDDYNKGALAWINKLMTKCGVIASEQAVQMKTAVSTDAKKREHPFHQVSRDTHIISDNNTIQNYESKPKTDFFVRRLREFSENLDHTEYRCKIYDNGIVKQLFVYQKSYTKYLLDMHRLVAMPDVDLAQIETFVPDMICFFGASEKLLSFPKIGIFDITEGNYKIKTIVTPLEPKTDYFGNIKKPWLTALNELMKDKGFMPVHGSLFLIEREDGQIYTVQVNGDSGVGKSEMLAAMMLRWLKKDLTGIRSVKQIAGDMFHVIPDEHGNLYGIGTEVGDFSRTTDFDIEYIKEYKALFESSADSNTDDKNARSTISGFCDISMPFKIDIILSASNFASAEAGIIPFDNPENFVLYRDAHGERKEKATSQDAPNFQRTLSRYGEDEKIVEILEKHGANLDAVLTWEKDENDQKRYIASSYKMIDDIDLNEIAKAIFIGKTAKINSETYLISDVEYNIIENRFIANFIEIGNSENQLKKALDQTIFSQIFDALASTPSGQPFITERGQNAQRENLIKILRGGKDGKGKGRNIRFGMLSTDLGREGKEITGPQIAVKSLVEYIEQINSEQGNINIINQQKIINIIQKCYKHIFTDNVDNQEVYRYNYYLYQMEEMRKAKFVRLDNSSEYVNISNLTGFKPLPEDKEFSPVLINPDINRELNKDKEVVEQLMVLQGADSLEKEFMKEIDKLYKVEGYGKETAVNNIIIQLLLLKGFIRVEDLTEGRILEKTDRIVIAVARQLARKITDNDWKHNKS